jgi:hypothetical protein
VQTPDGPDRLYSTRLRTAVVLSGSGTAGAYHAGVLRALHEAGVRTDLVAGRGVGAAGAFFAAIDGGARLWDAGGLWRAAPASGFYRWRASLLAAGWALVAAGCLLLFPLAVLAAAIAVGVAAFLLTLVGLQDTGAALMAVFTGQMAAWFSPGALPTVIPRLVLLAVIAGAAVLAADVVRTRLAVPGRWRSGRDIVAQLLVHPWSKRAVVDAVTGQLWSLIRGVAPLQQPPSAELGRRYVDLLSENLGQPGFRELLVAVHDLEARHDLVFAYLGEPHRARFFGRPAPGVASRAAEAFDLAGVSREHAIDVLAAALSVPLGTAPELVTFSREGPWRGEAHRLCDRPGALARILEEVAAAGVEQVVLVSAAPRAARAHERSARRADLRGHAGDVLGAFEASALRDVMEGFAGRFAGLYVIRPDHNPSGPFDFPSVYDERSDRVTALAELVDRGYEDAYRQFIDPVVGASGERMESAVAG